jgi:hypothetical protein
MPLEPLHFPILNEVVPSALLRNQTPALNQLPHPHRRHTEDLSGLFRRDQAHLTKVVRPVDGSINRIQIARRVRDKQPGVSSCL